MDQHAVQGSVWGLWLKTASKTCIDFRVVFGMCRAQNVNLNSRRHTQSERDEGDKERRKKIIC